MYKVKKISEIDKKYIRKNKNDQYYSNLIKENWGKLVGDIVAENSFPAFFSKGKLYVNVNDSTIIQQLSMYKDEVLNIFEKELGDRIVLDLDVRMDRKKKVDIVRNVEVIENNDEENVRKYSSINVDIEKIKLPEEEILQIEGILDKVDKKYSEIGERIKKIAIDKKREEKALKEEGIINCMSCGDLFLPQTDEKICIKCINKKEEEKLEAMLKEIKNNPMLRLESDMDINLYNRARDIISQDYFYDMIEIIRHHRRIVNYEDSIYNDKDEKRKEFNECMGKYIMYKIGSEDKDVQEAAKKDIIYRIKKIVEMKYKKNN